MSNGQDNTPHEGGGLQAEATAPETATGGLGDLAAAATASPVVTPEGGRKFATVEEAGAQSPAAARAFMLSLIHI